MLNAFLLVTILTVVPRVVGFAAAPEEMQPLRGAAMKNCQLFGTCDATSGLSQVNVDLKPFIDEATKLMSGTKVPEVVKDAFGDILGRK